MTAPIGRMTALLGALLSLSTAAFAQLGGTPGAYSRMGFGARGIGMGNAQVAVTSGDVISYYNPAALPLAEYRYASASFGILSLDRQLNFISYTQPLERAGLSVGIINSGVSDIDGRDSDGEPTGPLQTSENQIFLGFALKPGKGVSIGLNVKFLYYNLYSTVNTSSVGLDVGVLVPIGESITLGGIVKDINSKYQWNTGELYGSVNGNNTTDRFPRLYAGGVAYRLPDSLGILAADIEASDQSTFTARVGAEVGLLSELTLRAGVDRIDLKEKGNGVRPTFGFTVRRSFGDWDPAINYAFILEPFSPTAMHMISLSVRF